MVFSTDFAEKKYAVIVRCDTILVDRNTCQNSQSAEFYNVLPQNILPFYEKFMSQAESPFYGKLQMYHNFVFESGIRRYWYVMITQGKLGELNRATQFIADEGYYLKIDDISGTFYILFFGSAVSGHILFIEIFVMSFCNFLN